MRSKVPARERQPARLQPLLCAPKQSFQRAIIINTTISHVHLLTCRRRPKAENSSKSYVGFGSQTWQEPSIMPTASISTTACATSTSFLRLPQRKLGSHTHRSHWTSATITTRNTHSLIHHSAISTVHSLVHNTVKPTVLQHLVLQCKLHAQYTSCLLHQRHANILNAQCSTMSTAGPVQHTLIATCALQASQQNRLTHTTSQRPLLQTPFIASQKVLTRVTGRSS